MSWLVMAAEVAEEHHKDHTAYYVAGIALACWAVLVAALGIARPSFPGNGGGRAAVIAISAVLMIATTSSAVLTS